MLLESTMFQMYQNKLCVNYPVENDLCRLSINKNSKIIIYVVLKLHSSGFDRTLEPSTDAIAKMQPVENMLPTMLQVKSLRF